MQSPRNSSGDGKWSESYARMCRVCEKVGWPRTAYKGMNECIFSECRRYRYVLDHAYGDMFSQSLDYIAWIGLNPSIANEDHLDPTLRRIKSFTTSFGYHRFM